MLGVGRRGVRGLGEELQWCGVRWGEMMGNGPLLGMRDSVWEAEGWDPLWGSGVRVCWGLQEGKRVGVSKGQQRTAAGKRGEASGRKPNEREKHLSMLPGKCMYVWPGCA